MNKKPKKPQPFYSDSFKLGVVSRVANGEMNKEQARRFYGIGGKSSILEWMKKYGYCKHPLTPSPMSSPSDTPHNAEQLQKKIQQLQKQLKTERSNLLLQRLLLSKAGDRHGLKYTGLAMTRCWWMSPLLHIVHCERAWG